MASWANKIGVVDTVPKRRVFIQRDQGRGLVTVHQTGGIGNRIYQIWAGVAFAERTGREFVFVEQRMDHNSHTPAKATKDLVLALFPAVRVFRGRAAWQLIREGSVEYNEGRGSSSSSDIVLEGFFQLAAGGGSRGSLVVPRPIMQRFNTDGIDFKRTYFIHFRFGDYIVTEYNVDLLAYYRAAITAVLADDPVAAFLVFSDEPGKIVIADVGLAGCDYKIAPVGIGIWETLWQMSRCCGGICANSTFSAAVSWALPATATVYMPTTWRLGSGYCLERPAWALPAAAAI
jgi:hypothetical protein